MEQLEQTPPAIVGSFRRFGQEGIVYEVLSALDDETLRIRVLETGEETAYPLEDAKQDPTEH